MFDVANASVCRTAEQWTPAELVEQAEDQQRNIKRLRQRTCEPLAVVAKTGQWQLSGYLSIQLETAAKQSLSRLYFFDPESSTGPGGDW